MTGVFEASVTRATAVKFLVDSINVGARKRHLGRAWRRCPSDQLIAAAAAADVD